MSGRRSSQSSSSLLAKLGSNQSSRRTNNANNSKINCSSNGIGLSLPPTPTGKGQHSTLRNVSTSRLERRKSKEQMPRNDCSSSFRSTSRGKSNSSEDQHIPLSSSTEMKAEPSDQSAAYSHSRNSKTPSKISLGDQSMLKEQKNITNVDPMSPCLKTTTAYTPSISSSIRRPSSSKSISFSMHFNSPPTTSFTSSTTSSLTYTHSTRSSPVTTKSFGASTITSSRSSISSSFPDKQWETPIQSKYTSSNGGLVGLRNLGNTCFMNSILQCLSHTHKLTELILSGEAVKNKKPPSGGLVETYKNLLSKMWSGEEDFALSPYQLKQKITRIAPRFQGYDQQDCQEFLRFILAGIHDELNTKNLSFTSSPSPPRTTSDSEKAERAWKQYLAVENSRVSELFMGQLKSTLTCIRCGQTSVTFDPFWDLSLPIPKTSYSGSYISRLAMGVGSVTLDTCFNHFTKEEILDGDDKPICSHCKSPQKSSKKFTIQRLPEILVLHLKRFSGTHYRTKLNTLVDFPSNLDLKQFTANEGAVGSTDYSLYAVSNHSGSTYGGHYTAYCRHFHTRQWYIFNDSRLNKLSKDQVHTAEAYVLFYQWNTKHKL